MESGPHADYDEWVNALTAAIQSKHIATPDVLALLREQSVTHVYVGQAQGRVNDPAPCTLELDKLSASPSFRPICHQDRVWAFEIVGFEG